MKATGRLADPTDLEFDEDHLDDPDALAAAIDDLLARKPHLASRKPVGDIGQGQRGASRRSRSVCSGCSKNGRERSTLNITGLAPND